MSKEIHIHIHINLPQEIYEEEETEEEGEALPGGEGCFITDGDSYDFEAEGPYARRKRPTVGF